MNINKPYIAITTLVVICFGIFAMIYSYTQSYNFDFGAVLKYMPMFAKGFCVTIGISAVALIISTIISIIMTFLSRSKWLFLQYLYLLYIEIFRGSPFVVQILLFYYVIADMVGLDNKFIAGILILAINSSSYLAEIIRSSLESISKFQLESAITMGLNKTQTYKYVIIPQLIKRVMPASIGEFINCVKNSALLYIISVPEFTMAAVEVNSFSYATLESYIILAIGYLILTIPLSIVGRNMERKYKYET